MIIEAGVSMIPKNTVRVDESNAPRVLSLMEALDDLDDVQRVYSNFDIDEEILKRIPSSS